MSPAVRRPSSTPAPTLAALLVMLGLVLPLAAIGMRSARPAFGAEASPCDLGTFRAEYFDNRTLTGTPATTRCESTIDNDWGGRAPAGTGVGRNEFSVRWTGAHEFVAGEHTFTTTSDDGVRLWLDDQLLIDNWTSHRSTTDTVTVPVTAGTHHVRMEYYENRGGAVARLAWTAPADGGGGEPPVDDGGSCGAGAWQAQYYPNRTLTGTPTTTRCETTIANDWGVGSPDGAGVGTDAFSIRWTGTHEFAAGDHTFTTTSDDGIRLWFDDRLVIDNWTDHAPTTDTATVPVTAGTHTVRVEYYENGGGAVARVSWQPSAGTTDPDPQDPPPPGVPVGWPGRVELGMSSAPGSAADVASVVSGFRYQYLAGGVNTGGGWASWNPDGAFVTAYVDESRAHGLIPVFSYYMLYQSSPGSSQGEAEGIRTNLTTASTMAAYYRDLALFFQRASTDGGPVVLHVEPDLWAFMQHQATGDDATTVPVMVDGSGMAEVAGLPDTAAGFAQAIVRLRDRHAPNVILGYHYSAWGTGTDILLANPTDTQVRALAGRTAAFYRSTGASFDVAFTDLADRDAGFKQHVYGDGGASWLDAGDYHRSAVYIDTVGDQTGLRTVLWQLPYGNTLMRAMNNTWNHYQDNKVQTILGQPDRAQLTTYTNAGVIAYLFGPGAGGTTCACDWAGDGITNPAPINGNTRDSLNADDDGGYFRERATTYYRDGPIPLN